VAEALIQATNHTEGLFALKALAPALLVAAARLEQGDAKEVAAALAQFIGQMKPPAAPIVSERWEASHRLLATVARLEPGDAKGVAEALIQAMSRTHDRLVLDCLAPALSSAAARLEPRDAKEVAETLIQAISQTKDRGFISPKNDFSLRPAERLEALAPGLSAAAAHLEPKDAKEVATALALAMSQRLDPAAAQALAPGLSAAAARLDPNEARNLATVLMRHMSQDRRQLNALSNSFTEILRRESTARQPVLKAPPEPLSVQMLADLLNHLLCVGEARRVVLDQLGSRYGRRFENQWEFVRFAEEHKLGLDFTSPVQPP
jgi:hypothetical protein